MKIGIFGGTFNPPHTGHVQAVSTAAKQHDLDLVIVIPTGIPPHKKLPFGTPSPEMRFEMTKSAFGNTALFKVSDIEIYSNESNYTIDTVTILKREYTDARFFLLVGDDMFNSLDSWKESKTLLKTVTPILLSRSVINISSSKLREMLPLRKGREFINEENYSHIIKHRLYGAKPDWEWLRESAHSMLNPLRIPHVKACEVEALRLAERWDVDPDDAREAAILHDITKKLDFNENMCIIAKRGIFVGELGPGEEKLLHSISASVLAQSVFGVSDTVADAIRWHTTGRAKMTMLEKLIYLADYIESTRDFPEVAILRKAAYENIDDALIMGLEMTVSDLRLRDITPNIATLDALNDLKKTGVSRKEQSQNETDKQ
ncbi:MAG: nicotinate (nicotinamide) nucleotide adenylyltransferase [Oscillospiraceae bacterium]|jgi:nicotinate-nucleotide adenylyltransferase|nr:nicotinate (nicotinamide) nucleotide adenylyltransferase [Oscillospiraceae bacterium]